ncbi:hypothetical protein V474_21090 [Novosphingobium barchaimii LL02]|uniref:DUF2254 domain-containing protein n=1 Tax=Novosphingobium barchaimii LL02 TaxID=1114963 RepID=A0A0J7XQQ3_9SPHN|nr:DUF2254 domain-containing protein [Novosphingobium barchaimii]KMS54236.1 hypothetical protein V474_21090 [Novosphingobium barchaimii LL02]
MLASLRSNWFAVRASYWFYPALFSLAGLALALGLVHLDRTGATAWLANAHWIIPARPDGASNMLTVLAGSVIGVASTVFSITIAAVAYASGTFGPRLLNNFMEDKGNQFSLATFVGTFVYAISVLQSVRTAGDQDLAFVPQASLALASCLMLLCVAVLVYFLHHVPDSIRINSVLEAIGRRLLEEAASRFPEEGTAEARMAEWPMGTVVKAQAAGYIRVIDFDHLVGVARTVDMPIWLMARPGDFVSAGVPLVMAGTDAVPDPVAAQIRRAFALGGTRTPEQDLEFSIDELVEITLRALSPAVNDPFTAVNALHWLGAATSLIGQRDLDRDAWNEPVADCPVAPLRDGFDHFLARGLGSVRSGVATSPIACLVAFDTFRSAALQVSSATRREQVLRETDLLLEQARLHLVGPDLEQVIERHQTVRKGRST